MDMSDLLCVFEARRKLLHVKAGLRKGKKSPMLLSQLCALEGILSSRQPPTTVYCLVDIAFGG